MSQFMLKGGKKGGFLPGPVVVNNDGYNNGSKEKLNMLGGEINLNHRQKQRVPQNGNKQNKQKQ